MDQPLKQRLIGVTIAVALIVIFVPMLFDKSDDKGKSSMAGIPAIPDDVLEKPLELPKTAEDLAPKNEEKEKAKAPAESGYKIVPMNDEPAAKPTKPDKTSGKATVKSAASEESAAEEGGPAVSAGEEDDEAEAPEDSSPPQHAAETAKPVQGKAVKPDAPKPAVNHLAEPAKPSASAKPPAPKPAVPHSTDAATNTLHETAKAKPVAKPTDAATKKAEPADNPDIAKPRPAAIKTVKVNKPKPVAAAHDANDDEAPIPVPAPAKPETPSAKPKLAVATPQTAKKPETAKPSAAQHPLVKTDKPDAVTANINKSDASAPAAAPKPQPAKPATPKPATPKPATTWAVQAGSFTDEAAAKSLAEKLKQSKFPASVHAAQGAHGTVYRVQVGAERERGRAEDTLKQIEGNTGISGIITPRH